MRLRDVQFSNKDSFISSNPSGNVMLVKAVQPLNTLWDIVVKLFGSVTLVSEVQPLKALEPKLVTPSFKVMLESEVQP